MLQKIKPLSKLIFLLIGLSTLSPLGAEKVINIGELKRAGGVEIVPIAAKSSDARIHAMISTAFNMHGGFTLAPIADAAFVFNIEPEGPKSVNLVIQSGLPARTLFTQTITASSFERAVTKACDLCVKKTLGIPGFFSGKIAFVGERSGSTEIYVSDLLFQNVRQVTHDNATSSIPKWSPDGTKLLYTSYYKSGWPDIFLIDLNSGQRKVFASYSGTNTGAVFSPSGQSVAMILSSSGNPELYISDSQGRHPKRITKTKSLEASPVYSPNGSEIILTSDPMGSPQLYKVDLQTGTLKRIQTNLSKYCAEPTWNSVNRNLIAFTAAVNKTFQTALTDLHNGETKFLTEGSADHIEPDWTNDGRHLIVTKRTGGKLELYILDSLTGKLTKLHSKQFGNSRMGSFFMPKN